MSRSQSTVVVIGAGFSGTAVAANLLRQGTPLRVVLVNRFGPPGRGVAYGTRFEAHLLNVPVGQMSVFPDDPEHFLRYAHGRDPELTAASFVPRRLYGEYLEHVLREAVAGAVAGSTFQPVVGEATTIELLPDESGANVVLVDAPPLRADHVVLALGNYSPADPVTGDPAFHSSDRYIRDPWILGSLDVIEAGESVLIVGTGLTTMDIALDLSERGATPIHAVSPRGLLPRTHVVAKGRPASGPPAVDPDAPDPTIAEYVRAFRSQVATRVAGGSDWREVVGSIRGVTPRLWQALPAGERKRFLRHVRPFWDVHRHRAAPATASAIAHLIAAGGLEVTAGRVVGYAMRPDGVRVSVRRRGSKSVDEVDVHRVVNCTGPDTDVRRVRDPLIRSLAEKGYVRPDPLRLGMETTEEGSLIDAHGRASSVLSLVGPLLKARFWESTAVPELRSHAAALARRLGAAECSGTTRL